MKIINLIGGPGVGKSTTATGVFSLAKLQNISIEYVSEYAKDITYDETPKLLENQLHVFSEQFRRQYRLINKVNYIITDSPLILSSIYYKHYLETSNNKFFSKEYQQKTVDYFDSTFLEFDNLNVIIKRNKPYIKVGRVQTEDQSKEIDEFIDKKFQELNIKPDLITDSERAIYDVVGLLKKQIGKK